MKIENISLDNGNISMYQDIVDQCKRIIDENLQVNGGTLKVANLFEKEYMWTNLVIVTLDGKVIGFALVRLSDNKHGLNNSDEYYYLSDIVVKKQYQNQGIGTKILETVIAGLDNKPLVASCLRDNNVSYSLLSKYMTCYGFSNSGRYIRLVDNESYNKIYDDSLDDSISPNK